MKTGNDALAVVLEQLERHPKRALIVKVGKHSKDQLLRALVPLWLTKKLSDVEVSSVTTERFWKLHGHKFQAPRAAKALREHLGYSRFTKQGRRITPNGDAYVRQALGSYRSSPKSHSTKA